MLPNRFQIEEMLSQDAHGAVFLALDAETGKEVLLQRFFPFGVGSGGLEGEEQEAYRQAVITMTGMQHPCLQQVIAGGCDPVDGIPYLVCQAREGQSLTEFFAEGPINAEQGRALVETALDLMMVLEQKFGEGADWLLLTASNVEVVDGGKSYRFGVDPLKWLGLKKGANGVKELSHLAESALGWSGRLVAGSTAGTIGGWVRLAKSETMTAEQALHVLRGGAPPSKQVQAAPMVAVSLATPATMAAPAYRSALAPVSKSSKTGWVIFSCLSAVALLTGGGLWYQSAQKKQQVAQSSTVVVDAGRGKPILITTSKNSDNTPLSSEDQLRANIERRARELQGISENEAPTARITPLASREEKEEKEDKPSTPKRDGDYRPDEIEQVREQMGKTISLRGTVSKIRLSQSGKSVYIEFDGPDRKIVFGRYLSNLGKEGMSASELGPLEGKTVVLSGVVQEEFGTNRIVLNLQSRDQVKEQE